MQSRHNWAGRAQRNRHRLPAPLAAAPAPLPGSPAPCGKPCSRVSGGGRQQSRHGAVQALLALGAASRCPAACVQPLFHGRQPVPVVIAPLKRLGPAEQLSKVGALRLLHRTQRRRCGRRLRLGVMEPATEGERACAGKDVSQQWRCPLAADAVHQSGGGRWRQAAAAVAAATLPILVAAQVDAAAAAAASASTTPARPGSTSPASAPSSTMPLREPPLAASSVLL